MRSAEMLSYINRLYQSDEWVRALFEAAGARLEGIDTEVKKLLDNLFFDTAHEDGVLHYEKEANIRPSTTQTLANRRGAICAKWRSGGKIDVAQLQTVADAWDNGRVEVDFVNGQIVLTFSDEYGLPDDREGLERAIDEIKPAHLTLYYLVKYLLVGNVATMTVGELGTHKISEFAFVGS